MRQSQQARHVSSSIAPYHVGMATRSRWTDERLDDAFGQLRADIASLRDELRAFQREVRDELRELCGQLHETHRWLIGLFAAFVLGFIALIVEICVQG